MKHKFLLDENILHFAIKGINEHDELDETSTELVRLIASNCHRIILNEFLRSRYWQQLNKIRGSRSGSWAQERISFINEVMHKAEKVSFEANEYPDLPHGAVIPAEDVEIVRIARIASAIVISGDDELRNQINAQPQLGLRALRPSEALPLASEI